MTFDEIKERFAGAGTGTDAFRGLYNETFELMNADKEKCRGLFLNRRGSTVIRSQI
ncbi:Uncharacterised protein [Klebsiella michiganensis]|nr:Uncharacterised protein [Klebsiella michiganensis]